MQHPMHASIGASTLGPAPPAQAWGDAFRSIELVGTSSLGHALAAAASDPDPRLDEPIEAARTWLTDPDRRIKLGDAVVTRAEQTLQVASEHLRELDMLAGEMALEANETGTLDPMRLERVDLMAGVMRTYAQRMRDLLEPETISTSDAERRLREGLHAARAGGLAALVQSL